MKMKLRINETTIYHFCRRLRIRQNPDVNIIRTAVCKLFARTLTLSHFFLTHGVGSTSTIL